MHPVGASVTLDDVLKAAEEIGPFIHRTPVVTSKTADALASEDNLPVQLVMKCENLQKVGAFKIRGATNAIRSLLTSTSNPILPEQLTVVTHSSGNHAQALALAAKLQGVRAHVVMPQTSSSVKKAAVRGYEAEVTECIPTLEAREKTARSVIEHEKEREGRIVEFVPPYDDVRIIAGQGTIALELISQAEEINRPLDVLIAPVGGGGMLSGVALTAKSINPNILIIGAEPKGADDAYRSFYSKTFQPSVNPKTIADGLLTSTGEITFPLILKYVDAICTVEEDQIIRAMKFVFERMKLVIEPSAAVPLAVAFFSSEFKELMRKIYGEKGSPLNVGIVFSGGNLDLKIVSELFARV
ncbi:hypothetical protein M422DRAFT_24952 [Sphaerobolus stellatus SS14]|nr:hypothetical protein M422DRAFT_24952 [Sphaerobolus stellatus SS14]